MLRYILLLVDLSSKILVFACGVLVLYLFDNETFGYWSTCFAWISYIIVITDFASPQLGVVNLINSSKVANEKFSILIAKTIGLSISFVVSVTVYIFNYIDQIILIVLLIHAVGNFLNFEFYYRFRDDKNSASAQSFLIALSTIIVIIIGQFVGFSVDEILIIRGGVLVVICASFLSHSGYFRSIVPSRLSYSNIGGCFLVVAGGIFSKVYYNSGLIIVNEKLGNEYAGYLATILLLYMAVITFKAVVVNYLHPHLSRQFTKGEYYSFIIKSIPYLVIISSPLIIIAVYPNFFLNIIYRKEVNIVELSQALSLISILSIFIIITMFVPSIYHVAKKSYSFLFITVLSGIASLIVNLIFIESFGIVAACISIFLAEFLVIFYAVFLVGKSKAEMGLIEK